MVGYFFISYPTKWGNTLVNCFIFVRFKDREDFTDNEVAWIASTYGNFIWLLVFVSCLAIEKAIKGTLDIFIACILWIFILNVLRFFWLKIFCKNFKIIHFNSEIRQVTWKCLEMFQVFNFYYCSLILLYFCFGYEFLLDLSLKAKSQNYH